MIELSNVRIQNLEVFFIHSGIQSICRLNAQKLRLMKYINFYSFIPSNIKRKNETEIFYLITYDNSYSQSIVNI